MAEYITRNNAISAVCFGCNQEFSDEPCEPDACKIRQSIMALPMADVAEVKHGEWKWDDRFSDYNCSLCHNWDLTTPNYCSNCGAKMDGTSKEGGGEK